MKINTLASLILAFMLLGCTSNRPPTVSKTIAPSSTETQTITLPTATITGTPSVPEYAEANFPEGCIRLIKTSFDSTVPNGLFVVINSNFPDFSSYFLDPKSNQLIDIEKDIPVSRDALSTDVISTMVSPNKKFVQAYVTGKDYHILRTSDEIINTYSDQGQEDWNRGRWLDNERMVFQNWLGVPHGIYKLVIYNPFTGEQKNIQMKLPDPYLVEDISGKFSWVKADIDPSLKWVLYNDKEERLVLWDLDTKKEIVSLPSATDLMEGTWSPDGTEFAIPSPSEISDVPVANELFAIGMDGTVRKLTNFNQYPFANIGDWPSWSPDGHHIGFWLRVNPNLQDRWLAVIDTGTLKTQLYCLPSRTSGGDIIWSPDSQQMIVNQELPAEKTQTTLVDLNHQTQATLDTKGLSVSDWMPP
jgi:hypothetical protein